MKPNGHNTKHVDSLDLDLNPPIHPETDYAVDKVRYHGKKYDFYKKCPWPQWWDEFNGTLDAKGIQKYKTAWSFAKAKGTNDMQREVIYACIGPMPVSVDAGKTIEQPWLGDWQKRRSNGFAWALADPGNLASIKAVIKERKDALEAARALGPITAKQIARIARLADKIDDAFNGEPFLANQAPDSKVNQARFQMYLSMHKQVNDMLREAYDDWLKAHGVNPARPEQWLAMIGAAAAGGVLGNQAAQSQIVGQDEPTRAHMLLAKALIRKQELYQLDTIKEEPDVIEAASKPQ